MNMILVNTKKIRNYHNVIYFTEFGEKKSEKKCMFNTIINVYLLYPA